MKKILVTGGAGFIGSNLCRRLLKENNKVICLDNLYTGKKQNIKSLLDIADFEFVEHDVTRPIDLKVDEIYHLACPASPPSYQKYPVDTLKTCTLGVINMLELATKYNAVMMQFSTSEVYGNPIVHPQPETYTGNVNPIGIRACYDEGKRCAEAFCFDYNRQYGTKVKVIRIFNTYGPHMAPDDGRVISNFIVQALKGFPITIYGDGMQSRSFCYIDDLMDGIMAMMQKDDFAGPVNLGNPQEYTIKELAAIIIKKVRSESTLEIHPLPKDDPLQRKPDITLAKQRLGWQPQITLDEGLKHTIDYFKNIDS